MSTNKLKIYLFETLCEAWTFQFLW